MTNFNAIDPCEDDLPYIFISYSHKDQIEMDSVKEVLDEQKVRYWYDNGLHSGDDWNLEIASHLKKATACLLLLSLNSSKSEYVKNELNFAQNHRIPIHILLLHQFELPIDIEMMTGRIQMVEMTGDYRKEFIKSLPGEVFVNYNGAVFNELHRKHPLFDSGDLRSDRQGTKVFDGIHKRIKYPCAITEEILQKEQIDETKNLIINICNSIKHPVFPVIYDIDFEGSNMFTYQEFYGGVFLDEYLKEYDLEQDTIIRWIEDIVEGIGYLYKKRYAFRDFARGSLIVDQNNNLRFFRLYNPYYGVVRLEEETKRYYFEKNIQEIAILLAQLCTGKEPMIPIRMIETEKYDKKFLAKINLIIQKCTKENGRNQYDSFEEIVQDIKCRNIGLQDLLFLQKRKKKLKEYDDARVLAKEKEQFISTDMVQNNRTVISTPTYPSLEEEFGFEGTIALTDQVNDKHYKISVLICSTGRIYNFDKDEIIVGKGNTCDLVWTQPTISRRQVRIRYYNADAYIVTDLNSANGSYIVDSDTRLEGEVDTVVDKGSTIRIGGLDMKLL